MTKVLLVEDNEMNRDMLLRRLQRKGYEVITALDGEEAIQFAKQHQPDLVLMDMSLPVLDGWEATRRLKADPATRNIPVIALTAHALPAERDRALEAGCVAFETKPIDFPKLLSVMESVKK
jgi:CheY-like chemotaxis protein